MRIAYFHIFQRHKIFETYNGGEMAMARKLFKKLLVLLTPFDFTNFQKESNDNKVLYTIITYGNHEKNLGEAQ